MEQAIAAEILKILALPVIAALAIALIYTFFYGRTTASRRGFHSRKKMIESHKKGARWVVWCTNLLIVTIVALELVPHTRPPAWYPGHFVWTHVTVAVVYYLALIAVKLRYTGERCPRAHTAIVYWGIAPTAIFTVITGVLMYPDL